MSPGRHINQKIADNREKKAKRVRGRQITSHFGETQSNLGQTARLF